jgi:hypothetical protein
MQTVEIAPPVSLPLLPGEDPSTGAAANRAFGPKTGCAVSNQPRLSDCASDPREVRLHRRRACFPLLRSKAPVSPGGLAAMGDRPHEPAPALNQRSGLTQPHQYGRGYPSDRQPFRFPFHRRELARGGNRLTARLCQLLVSRQCLQLLHLNDQK